MYKGYRIKIEGKIVPNTMIAKGSYSLTKEDRVSESYIDADGIEHISTYGSERVKIDFQIKEHNMEEHESILHFIKKKNDITVEYFDDSKSEYEEGSFRMKEIKFAHVNAFNEEIIYENIPISLEEY